MKERSTIEQLVRQAAGGLLWSVFFVLSPGDVLVLGSPAWLALLIWRERRRSVRYGFWPGAACRFAVFVFVVAVAAAAPTKFEDKRVSPFPRTDVTLGELVEAGVIYPLVRRENESLQVTLPSSLPRRRQLMAAITEQTGFRTCVYHCAHVASVLFGGGGGRITVSDLQKGRGVKFKPTNGSFIARPQEAGSAP